jgi:uncharacterized Zn-finger protein
MTGPRFEQTDFSLQVSQLMEANRSGVILLIIHALQPQSLAAIELIHKQPVRWTHDRVVACDGGGGPSGHPRIFINTDKPEIAVCGYCGLPYVSVLLLSVISEAWLHQREYLWHMALILAYRPMSIIANTCSRYQRPPTP